MNRLSSRRLPRKLLLAGNLALLPALAAHAGDGSPPPTASAGATLAVANCNDSGPGSLRSAVAAAASGDTIDMSGLACRRIDLTSGAIAVAQRDLSLLGGPPGAMIVDAGRRSSVFRHSGRGTLSIKPQKSVIQAWSKLGGGDKFGKLLTTQNRKLEAVNYRFTKHYFSGIDQWQLVLQADAPTDRDGPYSTFTVFPNAWYYATISNTNPLIELPAGR